jgi:hypothetical protein
MGVHWCVCDWVSLLLRYAFCALGFALAPCMPCVGGGGGAGGTWVGGSLLLLVCRV